MQNPDHFVYVAAKYRYACVLTVGDNFCDILAFIFQINADNFVVRHHYVVNRHLFKIEDADKHLTIPC